MRVAELKGTLLDYWVARARGLNAQAIPGSLNKGLVLNDESVEFGFSPYEPSRDWSIAGPVLVSEKVSLLWFDPEWKASKPTGAASVTYYDASPLVAAMRCIVASRFGKEVADEDGLTSSDATATTDSLPDHIERRSCLSRPRLNGVERRAQHQHRSY